jgi:hypothetical protein
VSYSGLLFDNKMANLSHILQILQRRDYFMMEFIVFLYIEMPYVVIIEKAKYFKKIH